jgi:hypothetical protein
VTAPECAAVSVAVIAIKDNGARVLFSREPDRAAAEAMIKALARVGLHAEIDDAVRVGIMPGALVRGAPR